MSTFGSRLHSYDEVGNRLTQTDANTHTTSYQYDQRGRRTQRTLPLGQTETYSYDANGNMISKTDFNGKTTTYAYDTMNRLAELPPGSAHAIIRRLDLLAGPLFL